MAVKKAKKKVTGKKSSPKKPAKKPLAKKPPVAKKAVKKSPGKSPRAAKSSGKKTAAKPTRTKKPVAPTAPESQPTPSPKLKVPSAGSLKPDTRVRTLKGNYAGESGRIVRHDAYLGTYFLIFDAHKNRPAYKNVEWGPYFPAELEVVK